MKKAHLFLALLLIFQPGFATQSITNFHLTTEPYLGENLTINGIYQNTDSNAVVLCSAEIRDQNSISVFRLTDQYTFGPGNFIFLQKMEEPPLLRDSNYQVLVSCGTATASDYFVLQNQRGITRAFVSWWAYMWDQFQIILVGGLAVLIGFGLVYLGWKTATGR